VSSPSQAGPAAVAEPIEPASGVYYFEIAQGGWSGDFTFTITDFGAFHMPSSAPPGSATAP
jgi:hypothetical protein